MNNLSMDLEIRREIESSLNLIGGDDYKKRLICLSDVMAEILSKTLGPYAHTTIIDNGTSFPYPTKDGWTVLKNLNIGGVGINHTLYQFIKQISYRLASEVGDGTTTAVIAANEFIKLLSKNMEVFKNTRQADIIDMMKDIRDLIVAELQSDKYLHHINPDGNFSDIYNIAYTSSNRNKEISDIIHNIYVETKNPNIYIDIGNDIKTTYELQMGYKLDAHLLIPNAYINAEDKTYKGIGNHYFAIFDHNVGYTSHGAIIQALLSYINSVNGVLIIIAPHFDSMFVNTFAETIKTLRDQNQIPSILMLESPMLRKADKNYISDFATLVEADIIGDDKVTIFNKLMDALNNKEEPTDPNLIELYKKYSSAMFIPYAANGLGHCSDIVISPKSSYLFIRGYNKDTQQYKTLIMNVTEEYKEEKKKSEMATDSLGAKFLEVNARYVKLLGNMGIIHIGGESDLEKLCLRDSVDDAVKACKSAYEKGYVMGMNLAIISAANKIFNRAMDNFEDIQIITICEMIQKMFINTSIKVMTNKHNTDDDVWYHSGIKVPEHKGDYQDVIWACINNHTGYNIVTEREEDQDSLTVINSVDTDIQVLNAAISILSLILTSDQLISINNQGNFKDTHARLVKQKSEEYAAYSKAIADSLCRSTLSIKLMNEMNDLPYDALKPSNDI